MVGLWWVPPTKDPPKSIQQNSAVLFLFLVFSMLSRIDFWTMLPPRSDSKIHLNRQQIYAKMPSHVPIVFDRFLIYFCRSQQEAMKHILQSRVALVQGHEKSDLVVLMLSSIFFPVKIYGLAWHVKNERRLFLGVKSMDSYKLHQRLKRLKSVAVFSHPFPPLFCFVRKCPKGNTC